MRVLLLLVVSTLAVLGAPSTRNTCDPNCKLPNCMCMGAVPPNNMNSADVPQLVFLTFDDAITVSNYNNYTEILKNRTNPNGCPITMTFYVTHDYNDYSLTHNLYYRGNEMAVHSVTHLTNQTYWKDADLTTWKAEMENMRDILTTFANIPKDSIRGHRAPFLQTGGDTTIRALREAGLTYDNSYPTLRNTPPLWPYTMDAGYPDDCAIAPCPHQSPEFNGTWIVPMVDLIGLNGTACAMTDTCSTPTNQEETLNLLKSNFERHYTNNKAPFGIYLHAAWFQGYSHTLLGYLEFLDYLNTLPDVYIVSVGKGLEWLKNPVPLSQLQNFAPFSCPTVIPSRCQARNCYYPDTEVGGERIMRSCINCPDVYPWLNNPYGIVP